jgi:WD40 repeat protein
MLGGDRNNGEPNPVDALSYDASGRFLVSSYGGRVDIWDLQTKRPITLHLDPGELVDDIAVSPDNTLVTSSVEGVRHWDLKTGAQLAPIAGKWPYFPVDSIPRAPLALTANGQLVVYTQCSSYISQNGSSICTETQIFAKDMHSGQAAGFPFPLLVAAGVNSLALSPDGRFLAAGSNKDVQFWNLTTGLASGSLPIDTPRGKISVAFSSDDTLLAYARGNTVQLWNTLQNQAFVSPLTGPQDIVTGIAFAPGGKTLVASSNDTTFQSWDISSGKVLESFIANPDAKTSLTFSPDGQTLAIGSSSGTIILWDIARQSILSQTIGTTDSMFSSVFSTDGSTLLIGGSGKIFLHDAHTGRLLDTLNTLTPAHPVRNVPPSQALTKGDLSAIVGLALSRNGQILAAGRADGTVLLWDMYTRKEVASFTLSGSLTSFGLSANGQFVAAADDGESLLIWDVAKKTPLRSLVYHSVSPVSPGPIALSPDGNLLVAGSCAKTRNNICIQGQLLLWDVKTGKLHDHPILEHGSDISDVTFSPDGQLLASGGDDGIILYDVVTGQTNGQMLSLPAEGSYYAHVLFSQDGTSLASYTRASVPPFSFVVWDRKQATPLVDAIQESDADAGSVAFSPTGQQLAVIVHHPVDSSTVITTWDISPLSWQKYACAIANRNLHRDEWDQFVQDGPYQSVCPGLPLDS